MMHKPKTSIAPRRVGRSAFCLIEVVVSLLVLATISSSVLVVIDRCRASASDMALRAHAFAIVRENMERVLISVSVQETTDYGRSEQFPGIQWETSIETFSPPIGMDTWVRAVCKAKYEDDEGEEQEVELIHWLTALTDSQLNALGGVDGGQTGVLETVQEAADYAGVDPATIDVWLESGLVITPEGHFIPANLDLFVEAGGEPSPEELAQQRFDVSMDFEEDPAADWQEEGALDPEMDTGGDAGMQGPRRRER